MVKNKQKKLISIIISFLVVMSLISLKNFSVKANEELTKPTFKISNLTANTNRARVGEDILVSGELVPQDFEKKIKPKEIVLVLDTSKSMKDKISVNGVETSKIEEVKKSAIEFVDKMKEANNLKISIITYGSTAKINKINIAGANTSLIPVNKDNIENIKTVINNITPSGGTNIGEGLRQAIYLLNNSSESNKDADKTVILMSDALPTYCTVASKEPISYYLDTTKELGGTTWNSGSGSNDVYGYDLNYAKEIGKLINLSKFKVFTIGYGLQDEGLKKFKEIHSVMSGLTPVQSSVENGFYSKSDGSIEQIFNKVGDKIIENYLLQESELDLNAKMVEFNFNGNVIKVKDIDYKRKSTDEEVKKTGKIIYHADPIEFSFIARGTKVGDNQQILKQIDINFLFENNKIKESHTVDLRVDIIEDDLPHISANLISDKNIQINSNDEITLKYEVIPEEFTYYDFNSSGNMDVVIVLEDGYKVQNTMIDIKNALWNKLINMMKDEYNVKYSLIMFDNKNADKKFSLNKYPYDSKYYLQIEQEIKNIENGKYTNSNSKATYTGLKEAYNELINNSRKNASKNILLISNNDCNYHKFNNEYQSLFNDIKNSGINLVSLSLESEKKDSDLYYIMEQICGKNNDNIVYNNNVDNGVNNNTMDLARKKLISLSTPKNYDFNTKIKLNISNDFIPISGINNIGEVDVPTITYKHIGNNLYRAESKIVEVKLKANNLPSGSYNFGSEGDNYIFYKSLSNRDLKFNVKTPTIFVKPQVEYVNHGLYNGLNSNGEIIIQENNGQSFDVTPNSTVTFGSNFILKGNNIDLILNVDNNLRINDEEIKVYILINNKLEEVKKVTISNKGSNKYEISILGFEESTEIDKNILIVYRGTVGEMEKSDMKNTITITNISKDVDMSTKTSNDGPRLPDLF